MMDPDEAVQLVQIDELRTQRLAFRLPDPSLATELSEYYLRNAQHFAACCPRRPPGFHAVEAWRERAAGLRQASLTGRALHLLLFLVDGSTSEIVGDVNFTGILRGAFQAAYLGYELDRAHVGKGLMFEALAASIGHVFERMKLHRVMANYVPTNERSGRLLRKLGFSVEGYARDYLLLDGTWKDHVLTSLVNQQYRDAV